MHVCKSKGRECRESLTRSHDATYLSRPNDRTTWPRFRSWSSLSSYCRHFRSPETIGIMTRHRRCRRRRCSRHPRRDAPMLDRVDTGGGYWHSAGPPGLFTYKLYKYYFRANRPVDHYETPGGKFQRILLVPLSYLPLVYTYTHIRMCRILL